MKPDNSTLVEIYRRATLIKRADENVIALMKKGKLAIAYYSPRGQEIVSAAMSVHLSDEDYVVTTYRGIHDQLAKGVPLPQFFAEYAGRLGGTCRGNGGPMHITYPDKGVMVTTGIVAAGLPIANGLALAAKMRKESRVTVCNFGDGASNNGAFHEALNLASLWRLPVVFLCQNNRYAEHTPFAKGTAVESVSKRGASYDMNSISVDGNDPTAMWSAAREAVERARRGDGPTLLEAHTFRFRGHNYGDEGKYIPRSEYEAAVEADPVPLLRVFLLREGLISEASLNEIEDTIDAQIAAAVTFAMDSPRPEPSDLHLHVYAAGGES